MGFLLKSPFWLVLLIILDTGVEAQVNPVYQEIQKNRKAIMKGRRELKNGYTVVESFVDLGCNDFMLTRLNKVVDAIFQPAITK